MADTWCAGCGADLTGHDPEDGRTACSICGATTRRFDVAVVEKAPAREGRGFKHKRPGHKRPLSEGFDGWELRKSIGDLVRKQRLIDRENDRYSETIETEFGEVIRRVDEPLSAHTGHGSAKFPTALKRTP